MQAHLTRPENPAQKITYRVRDHGVVLISAWGISAVDDYQPLAGFRTLAAVAGVGDSARACIAGARITSSDNAGSRHFVDCRQSYPWDYFRIARDLPRVRAIRERSLRLHVALGLRSCKKGPLLD